MTHTRQDRASSVGSSAFVHKKRCVAGNSTFSYVSLGAASLILAIFT